MRTNNKEDLIVDLKGLYVSFRTFKRLYKGFEWGKPPCEAP